MGTSLKVSPPNSLIFVSDENGGEAPVPVRGAQILSTPSCVSVACYPEQDGPTRVTLGAIAELPAGDFLAFDGHLLTPSRLVTVSTVTNDVLLKMRVRGESVRLRILTNSPRWPDKVSIGVE